MYCAEMSNGFLITCNEAGNRNFYGTTIEKLNKAECLVKLAELKGAEIVDNPEKYSKESIFNHQMAIQVLDSYIEKTYPDFQHKYDVLKNEMDNVMAVNRELNHEIEALRVIINSQNAQLSSARKKIVSLKKLAYNK